MRIDLETFNFTNQSEKITETARLFINPNRIVNTLGGNDIIQADGLAAGDVFGLFINIPGVPRDQYSQLNTGAGNDTLKGTGVNTGLNLFQGIIDTGGGSDRIRAFGNIDGINIAGFAPDLGLNSQINTGSGSDRIYGEGISRLGILISNGVVVDTGSGHDRIRAISQESTGLIVQGGTIETGSGHDRIRATGAINGIRAISEFGAPTGTINTGDGHDRITGISDGVGILGGNFNLGSGNDFIKAQGSTSITPCVPSVKTDFGGSVLIDLGDGDDISSGFGEGVIDGGNGFDQARFDFHLQDFLSLGSISVDTTSRTVTMTFEDQTLTLIDIEKFSFKGTAFTLAQMNIAFGGNPVS